MEIKRIGILGTGLMGGGIAQSSAQAGYETLNIDIDPNAFERTRNSTRANLDKLVAKGKFTQQFTDEVISRMSYSTDMNDLKNCDIIIEAVPENVDIKSAVYKKLDKIVTQDTILLSNTSALSITMLAANVSNRKRFMGTHFFSPVPVMKLVELIRGMDTSDETYATVKAFTDKLGKISVDAPDTPGFIANRVIAIPQNEAASMVAEGVKAEDIDNAMKLFVQAPLGPLEAADFGGLQITLGCLTSIYEGLYDNMYRPDPYIRKLVQSGRLGRPTGKGFRNWA